MKKHINKLSAIQKVAARIGGAVVVLASATDFFAGTYLVNYAIGRSGDGGNRTVSDDADAKIEAQKSADAETIINDTKKQMGLSAALFEEAPSCKRYYHFVK